MSKPVADESLVEAVYAVARALKLLGNADASTPMGGLEALGLSIQEGNALIAGGLSEVASAIEHLAEAVAKMRSMDRRDRCKSENRQN